MLLLMTKQKWFIGILATLSFLSIFYVISNINPLSIWQYLHFSEMDTELYWQKNKQYFSTWNIISLLISTFAIGFVLLLISFILSFKLRKYDEGVRSIFLTIFNFLGAIPCTFWAMSLFFMTTTLSDSAFSNFLMFLITFSVMVFPMLTYNVFKNMNNISDKLIETGYSLGATDEQIAFKLIAPKLKQPMLISGLLIFLRLSLELSVLAVALGIWTLSFLTVCSLVLLVLSSGVLVFILKRK